MRYRLPDNFPYRRVAIGALCAVLLAAAAGVWWLTTLDDGLPDDAAIHRIGGDMAQATAVFDRNDAQAFSIFREQRIDVPLSQVSRYLQLAVLSIEDRRFFDHNGLDLYRIASSMVANLREFRLAQGGSTITQQLARQSFLKPQKTFRRKFQELILARRIERAYTKQQILELYLNKIYFGDGLHGVEAASRGYFDKHASELTIAEAALLAGLIQSPSNYAPTTYLDRAKARRGVVLDSMLDEGVITRAEWDEARTSQIALHDGFHEPGLAGQYFKEQVRHELVERFGMEAAYASGLRVFTTIDVEMQKAAEAAIETSLKALEEERAAAAARRKRPQNAEPTEPQPPLQAALIAMDPETGDVRAIVGGRNFEESPFNRATSARRQPGSAFKPFVFAAALENGYTPATVLTRLDEPIETREGDWSPEDEHLETTTISLRDALRTSSNRAAVRLMTDVGIDATVRLASQVGMEVPRVPSLALGSGEVTLDALTAAYATFANGGKRPKPRIIRRIEDRNGQVLYTTEADVERVISDKTAFLMSSMLAGVIDGGTGARARTVGFTLPAGGKTGTTTQYKDAWFVGFTPSLVAGVWVGFDEPQPIMQRGYASDVAVPAWARFMKEATKGNPSRWFSPPKGITSLAVCRLSGKLAVGGCDHVSVESADGSVVERSMVYKEYFASGTEPVDSCELHSGHRGFLGVLASAVGVSNKKPDPVNPDNAGIALPSRDLSTAHTGTAETTEASQPAPQKRGFWSRLFGVGKDNKQGENKQNDKSVQPARP